MHAMFDGAVQIVGLAGQEGDKALVMRLVDVKDLGQLRLAKVDTDDQHLESGMGQGHRQVGGDVALAFARDTRRHLEHFVAKVTDVGPEDTHGLFERFAPGDFHQLGAFLVVGNGGQDGDVGPAGDIELAFDLALESLAQEEDTRRDDEAQEEGHQVDHLPVRGGRRGGILGRVDDLALVGDGVE